LFAFYVTPPRLAPRDSRFILDKFQNKVKNLTNGEYSIYHQIYGEMLPDGTYRMDGAWTHGQGELIIVVFQY
jgi:hypothetical protein